MKKHANTHDAIVVGGGPAGSTAAAVLAMKGRRVVLLEKEKFPRYHIGESLMPHCYFPLKRIGLIEKIKASHFTKKHSVQFVSTNGKASQPFYFFQHMKHEAATTWQVLRSEFDQILLDNAREKGATVMEEMCVKEVVRENGAVVGVRGADKAGTPFEFRAPMTIDATGRDGLTQIPSGWRVRDPYLNKVAIWTYYKGAMRDPGLDEGATTVAYVPEKGWFWYIPQHDDMVSVGIVAEAAYLYKDSRDPAAIFHREVENNLWIKQHLAVGKCTGEFRVTGEFSFRAKHCASDGLVMAGDAFAFLDPVFSSGVFLALRSGEMAADAVDRALTLGDVSASQFEAYGRELCKGIETMRKLVYAFYDQGFSFKDLVMKYPGLKRDLTDCLIGDLFKDTEQLFRAVAEFAQLPPPLDYGAPLAARVAKEGASVYSAAAMSETVEAIYENGVLRPLQPLHLRDSQRVSVQVSTKEEDALDGILDREYMEECRAYADDTVTLEEVRAALSKIPGSMTADFIAERDERF
jgi:flavin-dependent dehydrogenase/predicted DNA-binding antitoxin AbrB/MazE fold protein